MPIELEPLCRMEITLATPMFLPLTPSGTRVIGEVTAATITGPRLNATLKGAAAADWLTMAPDGQLGSLDVRFAIETDDGALAFVSYRGRLHTWESPAVAYATPLFDTGDERYQWLARLQAVAKGVFSPDMSALTYEVFELR